MVFLISVFILPTSFDIFGWNADKHNQIMWEILTGTKNPSLKSKSDEKEALQNASYLCVDQCNGMGQGSLNQLKEYGVKGIIDDISEINYGAGGDNHREKTHMGWNNLSNPDFKDKWDKRKKILLNTVDKVFDFENDEDIEAFSKLIYYIHIIGDYEYNDPFENDGLIALGGKYGGTSVISELRGCIKTLFKDQHSSYNYIFLQLDLQLLDSKVYRLYNEFKTFDPAARKKKYDEYVSDLKKYLSKFIPKLLKNEEFFTEVFTIS